MRWLGRLGVSTAVAAAALLLAAVGLTVLAQTQTSVANLVLGLIMVGLTGTFGVLILRRQPGNAVGLLLTLVGLAIALTATREVGLQVIAARLDDLSQLAWLVAITAESGIWVMVLLALLLLYFPDGRLPSARWVWIPPVMVACALIHAAYESLGPLRPPVQDLPKPFGPPPVWFDVLSFTAFVGLLGLLVVCALSLVLRYRRGNRVVRRQIRWLALVGVALPLYPLVCLAEVLVWGQTGWASLVLALGALCGIPVATAVAVLRHDLYDIDKALVTAITWAILSTALVAVFAATSVAAGVLLGRESAFAAAAVAALCAVALTPFRSRVQRAVDRRLYPQRRSVLSALEAFRRDISAGRAQPEQLEHLLRSALRDPVLCVGYRSPGDGGLVGADGKRLDGTEGLPIRLNGAAIGMLQPGTSTASVELLRQVADEIAVLVEVVRLRLEVKRVLREVESSRVRLVQASYEERRQLERDLHDGAQQRLVSLGLSIRLAQRHLGDGSVDVNDLLDRSVAELGTSVAELRQIAHGLRPRRLDDGLCAALTDMVRALPVEAELEVCAETLPDDLATTAYFVATEAVTNSVKHADARRIGLRVARENGCLVVQVRDDGRGGARVTAGSSMADRVAALGGSLRVASPSGRGTVVEAVLPCGS